MGLVSSLILVLAALLLVLINILPCATRLHITQLLRTLSSTRLNLSSSPRDRFDSLFTVSLAIFLLLLKHLGLGPSIRGRDVKEDGSVPLPDLRISAPISVTKRELGTYSEIVQQSNAAKCATETTETPLLLLAPLITPLIPSLLILRQSPIRLLGAVNVRNTFIFHRPDILRRLVNPISDSRQGNNGDEDKPRDTGRDEGMIVHAQMGGELRGRKMKRGVEFDTLLTVSSTSTDGSDPIFSFRFTTLSLISLASAPLHPSAYALKANQDETGIHWYSDPLPLSISANLPLSWARLSKDYNPIHTSGICAKLFGLKGKIAHGNMVLSMIVDRACQAHLAGEGVCQKQLNLGRLWTGAKGGSWLIVEFKRPVFVPSRYSVRWGKGRVQVYEVIKRDNRKGGEVGLRGTGKGEREGEDEEVKVLVDIRAGEGVDVPTFS